MLKAKEPLQDKEYKLIRTPTSFNATLEREINEAINEGFKIERVDIIDKEYIVWLYRLPEEDPETILEYAKKVKDFCSGKTCGGCAFDKDCGRCELHEILEI